MDMFSDSENAAQTVEKAQQFIALHHVQYTQSYNDEIIDTRHYISCAFSLFMDSLFYDYSIVCISVLVIVVSHESCHMPTDSLN